MKLNGIRICLFCVLALTACGKTEEAREQLQQARILYENKQFSAAKNAIDTLRMRYPRELEVLKETLVLMRLIERGESERNIAFCDSLMLVRTDEAGKLKRGFVFEKDSVYEETGNYVWKQQTVERNVERSYIRCGVDEKGEIYLASVYFGKRPLNHTGLKLSLPDGTYAQTASIPHDGGMNYRFKDEGNITEVVTYKGENGLSAINFVYSSDEKARIKVEYTGGAAFSLYLGENDKKAIRATYDLAVVLKDIEFMRRGKEKSVKKLLYIDSKLAGNNGDTEDMPSSADGQ
ncbi:MAG: hypothetical protein LBP50_04435 [Tannerella sp.]|jgi:hypothetical protein|nr:hypothetical protein [Tannerella sp.]